MKIKLLIILLALNVMFVLGGWGNRTLFDTTYTFNRAIVRLADGTVVDGKCQTWTDYEDCDMIQVQIDDDVYYIHGSNVSLIKE